jgi:hypothetical protein
MLVNSKLLLGGADADACASVKRYSERLMHLI